MEIKYSYTYLAPAILTLIFVTGVAAQTDSASTKTSLQELESRITLTAMTNNADIDDFWAEISNNRQCWKESSNITRCGPYRSSPEGSSFREITRKRVDKHAPGFTIAYDHISVELSESARLPASMILETIFSRWQRVPDSLNHKRHPCDLLFFFPTAGDANKTLAMHIVTKAPSDCKSEITEITFTFSSKK